MGALRAGPGIASDTLVMVSAPESQSPHLPRPVLPALHADVHPRSMLDHGLGMMFGNLPAVTLSMPGRALFNNAARLVDKAVVEYEAARTLCQKWVASIDADQGVELTCFFRGIDRMENCVGALHRALLNLEQIRTHPSTPTVDRTVYRALQSATQHINTLRDNIEHADKDLTTVRTEDRNSPIIFLEDDRVVVFDACIHYADLAQWIYQTFRYLRLLFPPAPPT